MTNNIKRCPSSETLCALQHDTLPDSVREKVKSHLTECPSCRGKISDLSGKASDQVHQEQHQRETGVATGSVSQEGFSSRLWGRINSEYKALVAGPQEVELLASLKRKQPIGKGGLGEVFLFADTSLQRDVAVKIMRREAAATDNARCRFELECEITGALEHPGIAPIYGVGQAPDGRPLYAMRYVDGETLTDRINAFHVSRDIKVSRDYGPFRSLIQCFQKACEAVAYAHRQGVIHRDLKPDNIVVKDDVTTVIDWGLAKRLEDDDLAIELDTDASARRNSNRIESNGRNSSSLIDADSSGPTSQSLTRHEMTRQGSVLGSPSYMSPEQAAGSVADIDRRTDIYGLGGVLFEILTSSPPHEISANVVQSLQKIAYSQTQPPIEFNPQIPRELNSICLKCLQREPANRYPDVEHLIADIERWILHQDVQAHAYTLRESARRMASRNAGWIGLAAGIFLFCLLVGGAALVAVSAAWEQERSAKLAVMQAKSEAEWQRDRAFAAGESARIRYVQNAIEIGRPPIKGKKEISTAFLDGRLIHRNWRDALNVLRNRIPASRVSILAAAMNADRSHIAYASADGSLSICEAPDGRNVLHVLEGKDRTDKPQRKHYLEYEGDPPDCFLTLGWLNDHTVWAASFNRRVVTYDMRTALLTDVKQMEGLVVADWSNEHRAFLTANNRGDLQLIRLDGAVLAVDRSVDAAATTIQWWPTRQLWVVARDAGNIELRDAVSLRTRLVIPLQTQVWSLATSPNQPLLVVSVKGGLKAFRLQSQDQDMQAYDSTIAETDQTIHTIAFTPDGSTILGIDDLGRLEERNVRSLDEVIWRQSRAHILDSRHRKLTAEAPIAFRRLASAIMQDSRTRKLYSAGQDGTIAVWNLRPKKGLQRVLTVNAGPEPQLLFDPANPRILWALNATGDISLIDYRQDRRLDARKNTAPGGSASIAVHGPTNTIATVCGSPAIQFWRRRRNKIVPSNIKPIRHSRSLASVSISPRGTWIAAVDDESTLLVWEFKTRNLVFKTQLTSEHVRPLSGRIAFDDSESMLAAFGAGQACVIFECLSGGRFRRLPDQPYISGDGGLALAWNPQRERMILVADSAQRFDSREFAAAEFLPWSIPDLNIRKKWVAMDITPDGERVAVLSENGRLVFVDSEYGFLMSKFKSRLTHTTDFAIGANDAIAVAGRDGGLEIWESHDANANGDRHPDHADRWEQRILAAPTDAKLNFDSRAVGVDARGRPCAAVVESRPGDFQQRGEGGLYFSRLNAQGLMREQIALGDEFDRRITERSYAIHVEDREEPLVAFRRRYSDDNAYASSVHVAERRGPSNYEFQTVATGGNFGLSPYIDVRSDGSLRSLLHFDYYRKLILRSHITNDGWKTTSIGRQGMGNSLLGARGAEGRILLSYQYMRFTNDPFPDEFIQLDPVTRQIEDRAWMPRHRIASDPSGVAVRQKQNVLQRYEGGRWRRDVPLPKTSGLLAWTLDEEGRVWATSIAGTDADRHLLFWRREHEEWKAVVVAKQLASVPSLLTLVVKNDQPTIFLGLQMQQNHALWVVTPR